jgi:hypothetical protein
LCGVFIHSKDVNNFEDLKELRNEKMKAKNQPNAPLDEVTTYFRL